ncbi:MAG: peptidase LD-carboxypeptidase [Ferruginibacter sp.]|nr:peptidase LD-carboxypeptidase [Ferruginibacter sp.]
MNRKNFLASIIPLAASFPVLEKSHPTNEPGAAVVIPPYLKKGDNIGITCPAGYITAEEIEPSLIKLSEWGFITVLGKTVGKKDFTYGGTDEERLNDFQQMLDDKNIRAILCARGGYGAVRIIDKIDFRQFVLHPKWIIGFSDITVMHSHLNRNYNIASIHSKMCNSFPADWSLAEPVQKETIESIQKCLSGEKMNYTAVPNSNNKMGIASGALVGGNLKTIESLAGSSSDLVTKNKILFVEDTGEYLYSIDRMFWNLKRSGKLDKLSGLMVGGFKIKKDDEGEAFGKTLEEIVLEKVTEYHYPVCFDFPVGHQKNNFALKCGIKHRLTVQPDACTLTEI